MKKWRFWTTTDHWQAVDLIERGFSLAQVGAKLNRGRSAVREHFRGEIKRLRPRTATQAAAALGVPTPAVRRWLREGYLRSVRAGQARGYVWRITDCDLRAFVEAEVTWHLWQPERISDPGLRAWALECRTRSRRLLSVRAVAQQLSYTENTVRELLSLGRLRGEKVHGAWLVEADSVASYRPEGQRARRFSDREDCLILQWTAQGETVGEIGRRLGRWGESIRQRIRTLQGWEQELGLAGPLSISLPGVELDQARRTLRVETGVHRLSQQELQFLLFLLAVPGRPVQFGTLWQHLWQRRPVGANRLNALVYRLRRKLGESGGAPRYLETVGRVGFRWLSQTDDPAATTAA